MRSILCAMAVRAAAPGVRTVVEVNHPGHVEHFKRSGADEVLVTSRIASRLLARSSLYPGLAELVTDIVSGDDAIVVAESLGTPAPLVIDREG